jgi:hypothetical protein
MALRAAGPAAVQGANALAEQDAGKIWHAPIFAVAQDVPPTVGARASDTGLR